MSTKKSTTGYLAQLTKISKFCSFAGVIVGTSVSLLNGLMFTDSVVYQDNFRKTVQIEFQSLASFRVVSPAIIDTWSSYLNNMEKLKAPETVSRLFFSTRPCKHTVVDTPPDWAEQRQFDSFWTLLFEEALGTSSFHWENYDMFFFPIWGNSQQYVVCFDLRDGEMNIIDHSLAESHDSFNAKYGKTPSMLKKLLADALAKCKVQKMATQIRKCSTHVVTMSWRNNIGTMETRVYVMRHMETYFGEREKEWDCGLSAKGTKSLEMLRIKFARTRLTCAHNSRGGINQTAVTRHWREKLPKFNFDKWVNEYGLE